MYHDDFDPHCGCGCGDDGYSYDPPGSGADLVWLDPAGYGFDVMSPPLVLERGAIVLVDDESAPWSSDQFRNLRIGLPSGRSWKVKVNWPLVRRLGVTYGPAAATVAATAAGVPLPVAAIVGQVVGETLKSETKPQGAPPAQNPAAAQEGP